MGGRPPLDPPSPFLLFSCRIQVGEVLAGAAAPATQAKSAAGPGQRVLAPHERREGLQALSAWLGRVRPSLEPPPLPWRGQDATAHLGAPGAGEAAPRAACARRLAAPTAGARESQQCARAARPARRKGGGAQKDPPPPPTGPAAGSGTSPQPPCACTCGGHPLATELSAWPASPPHPSLGAGSAANLAASGNPPISRGSGTNTP